MWARVEFIFFQRGNNAVGALFKSLKVMAAQIAVLGAAFFYTFFVLLQTHPRVARADAGIDFGHKTLVLSTKC